MLTRYVSLNLVRLCRHQRLAHGRCLSSIGKEKIIEADVKHTTSSNYQRTDTSVFEPERLKSLNIARNIETMHKPGSNFYNYFRGYQDKDLLSFPFLLRNRKEFLEMTDQYEMIRKTWNMIKTKEDNLELLGYCSMQDLSVSEMLFIFEAIGAGEEKLLPFASKEDGEFRFEKKLLKSFNASKFEDDPARSEEIIAKSIDNLQTTLNIILPLIANNAIINRAMNLSSNEQLKHHVASTKPKIGLALSEAELNLPNLASKQFWSSTAKLSRDKDFWLLSANKTNIIAGDYDYYLVYAQTNNFHDQQAYEADNKERPGLVALLVPKDKVDVIDTQSLSYGLGYQTIQIKEQRVPCEQYEVLRPTQDYLKFYNKIGCGQLSSSAVILGLLKQMLRNTYAYLINKRTGLLESELIQYRLYQATCKIYSIESTLYLTAAMFDSFEADSNFDAECRAVKTLAIEHAYDVVRDIRSIFGSKYPYSSSVLELVSQLDTFLDSAHHNRLAIAQNAIVNYIKFNPCDQNKFRAVILAPVYNIKKYMSYRKLRSYKTFEDKEMTKYVHHNLHVVCHWINDSIVKLDHSCEWLINFHTDITSKEIDMNRLTTIAMNIYTMISALSRANQSLSYGRRNGDAEKEMCIAICKEHYLNHLNIFEKLERQTMTENDDFVKTIAMANRKENGYFPSVFDVDDQKE